MRAVLKSFLLFAFLTSFLIFAESSGGSRNDEKILFDGSSLDHWAITDYAGHGEVSLDGNGSVVLEFGIALTGIHWVGEKLPRCNYQISWSAQKVSGTDFFASLTFPYLNDHATLVLGGWGGALVGISCLDGFDASENQTATAHLFNTNQWYRCVLRVTDTHFKFWVDQEKLIDCDIQGRTISMRTGEIELSKPLGFSTFDTTGLIKDVRLSSLVP
jgi:hypothetical protein